MQKNVIFTVFLRENDSVQILIDNNQIIIKKAEPKPEHKTLKQRVEEFYGKDFETVINEQQNNFEEMDSGLPVGEEIW